MYKIIELGSEVPQTGEPRVQLLQTGLTKTASTEIQRAWDKLEQNDNYSYIWVIGVSAYEYYGCNNNGDAFTEEELKKNHNTFLTNSYVYLHHVNKDPNKSIGVPIFTYYNENMHRVELILRLDKTKPSSKDTIDKIKSGDEIGVSMGCRVKFDVCSICGNKAKTRRDYCNCAKYNMKKILPDGRQVCVFNPNPQFFDISVVNKPADPIALTLDKVASGQVPPGSFIGHSADKGEEAELYTKKIAALDKFSDIMKKVDGVATDVKDGDEDINILKNVDLSKLDYPVLGFDDLDKLDVAGPGCILHAIAGHGAPPSIGEITYASGKYHMGDDFTEDMIPELLKVLPIAIKFLRDGGAPLERLAFPIIDSGMEDGVSDEVMASVEPVAKTRVCIIKQAMDKSALDKFASEAMNELDINTPIMEPPVQRNKVKERASNIAGLRSAKGPGFYDTFTVKGNDGKDYYADRRATMVAQEQNDSARFMSKALGTVLGAASIGAILAEPDLAKKLIASTGLGIGSVMAWNTEPAKKIKTQEGYEIPANTLFHEKTSASKASLLKNNLATIAGMSIPAALGLDYAYNKKFKYKDVQHPEMYMNKRQRTTHKAGNVVSDSPATAVIGGGLLGAGLGEGARKLLGKLSKVK